MASFHAIAATGRSLERLLNAAFDADEPVSTASTRAVLVRSDDFDLATADNPIVFPALSLFLYRVTVNGTMRAAWAANGTTDGRARLPLDLHFLLTAWADNAEWEHLILGRALQCLQDNPVLAGPLQYPSADWAAHEAVQVVPDEMSLDDVLRTFDSLEAGFRLSVGYVARIVRLDGHDPDPFEPVRTVVDGLVPSPA